MPVGVELRGVTKVYPGGVRALDGIDLKVKPGEFFTLLGPSGCGKTTLLRTIAGFEQQDAGSVTIGERPVDAVPPQKRNLGVVFQSHAVFPHLDVFENVAFGLRARGVSKADVERRVAAALERVRLTGLGARTPDALSGGQQQRVGLARALVIEPDVLLMDEPLSSLDARLRLDMRDEVRALQRALGITTIYVTHDQEEALAVSDRVAVMSAGRIEQVGTPWEVYGDPATQGVASFVGRVTLLGEEDARKVGLEPPPGGRVAVRPEHVRLSPLPPARPAGEPEPSPAKGVALDRPGTDRRGVRRRDPLTATVGRAAFTGPLVTYPITCNGVELLAEEHRPGAVLLTPGTVVMLTIEPHHALRFDRDGHRVLP